MIVKCDYCGKEIHKMPSEIKRNKHNFCSKECHYKFRRKRVTIKCDYCGEKINKKISDLKDHNFCSQECYHKWTSDEGILKGENHPKWKPKVTKTCKQCGQEFKVYPNKKDKRKFCSRECYYKWKSENIEGRNNPRYKPKITKTCKQCGKRFQVIPSRKNAKFCSEECLYEWFSKPENTPFYGKQHTKETKKKISKSLKGREINWGDKVSETLEQYYEEHPERKEKLSKRMREWWDSISKEEFLKKLSESQKGRKLSKKTREKQSKSQKQFYKNNPEKAIRRRKKAIKALMERPTKPEQKFIELCKKFNLPYKYVGAGDFWIENMNPDFVNVNGKKVAVEILGDFWHTGEGFKERKEKFKEYGWNCVGVWGHEIKNMPDGKIINKIKNGT